MSENPVVSECLEFLARCGISCWRQNNHAVPVIIYEYGKQIFKGWRKDKYHLPGKADISGILPDGRRLEVECKSGEKLKRGGWAKKQQPEQIAFQEMIQKNKGVYILAHSEEELKETLFKEGILHY